MSDGLHFRTCTLCEAMCGVAIEVRDGEVQSIRGDTDDPFGRGHICPKAVALKDIQEDPDRLRQPLQRIGNEWREISWNQAFALVARRLHDIRREHGRNAVGVYLGNPNVHNHGAMLGVLPFLRALGTQNRFSATSNDQLPHMLANLEMFGHQFLFPIPDLDHTDLFICIGANPMASNGSLMSVPDFRGRLKDLRARGGRLVVIDPRRTETAQQADEFHFVRPGTDALLLLAMIHTLFAEDLVDPGEAAKWCRDEDLVRLAALPYSPEAVAEKTGMAPAAIRDLARQLAGTPRAVIYGRIGTSTQAHGGLASWLINVLNILTGKLDRVGGTLFTQPAIDMVSLGGVGGQRGHFGRRYSRVRHLPEFGGEYPASTMADEILTPGDGQIRGFVTVAGNPVLSSPNGARLDQAFGQLDFMVSIDFYLNETTRHADVILPPTGPLERGHYDLIFNAMAIRNVAKWSDPVFEPGSDTRSDWQILMELAHRLNRARGLDRRGEVLWRIAKRLKPETIIDLALRAGPYGAPLSPVKPILQPTVDLLMDLLPRQHWLRTLLRASPHDRRWQQLPKGLSVAMLRDHPHGVDLGPLQPSLPDRLYTADGVINLAPRRYLQGLEGLYRELTTAPGDELRLIGRRHVRSNNSWLHNSRRLVKGKGRCTLMIHPRDAARLGLEEKSDAEVTSDAGRVILPVEITDSIMPGVVSIPHGWGHARKGVRLAVASAHAGASINDVIRDDQVDELCGTSVLNGQPVTVKPHCKPRRRKTAKQTTTSEA